MSSAITIVRGKTDYSIPLHQADLIQIERVADARAKRSLRHRLAAVRGVDDVDYDSVLLPGQVFFSVAPNKDTQALQDRVRKIVGEYLDLAASYPLHPDAALERRPRRRGSAMEKAGRTSKVRQG